MTGKIVALGEVMLRLTPQGVGRFFQTPALEPSFGGGESNTAASLARLGLDVAYVTALPDNPIGDAVVRFLREHGVDTSFILRQGDRLGVYFVEFGAGQRPSQVVYDRAHSAIAEAPAAAFEWDRIFEGASWLHVTGITPAISRSAADLTLAAVRAAHAHGVRISCDTSYRNKLWQYGVAPIEIMPEIARYANLLYANLEDCSLSYGVALQDSETRGLDEAGQNRRIAEKMFARFPNLQVQVFTHRQGFSARHNAWGASLYNGEELIEGPRYDIARIVDRLGGGDALAAGLIYGFHTGMSDREALAFASAAACLKHSIHMDVNRVYKSEIEKLMLGDASGRVQR